MIEENREVVIDTETTGMDPADGHRIVEIGCVELVNHLPSGRTLQLYLNPERDIPPEATAVHGLTGDFLKNKPVFSQVYSEMIDFIGAARLIIHNAEFDMKFLNAELKSVGHPPIQWGRVVDTLAMARRKFPGSPANLDALCRRFEIDNSGRSYHGALLDSELLAEVYLELLGGRQHGFSLAADGTGTDDEESADSRGMPRVARPYREPRVFTPSAEELIAHDALIKKLKAS